jgi:hypothetical protein
MTEQSPTGGDTVGPAGTDGDRPGDQDRSAEPGDPADSAAGAASPAPPGGQQQPGAGWPTGGAPSYGPFAASGFAGIPQQNRGGGYPPPSAYPPPGAYSSGPGYGGQYGPGYNQYPYPYPYPQMPPPPGTNTMAILAMVFAFVFSPLGIVFGAIALRQISRTQEEGRGLAIAGICVGVAFTLLIVLYIVFIIFIFTEVIRTGINNGNPTQNAADALRLLFPVR